MHCAPLDPPCLLRSSQDRRCACRLILRPVLRLAARAHAAEARIRLAEQIEEARQQALQQQAVMRARVARLAAADADKTGFAVVKVRPLRTSRCLWCIGTSVPVLARVERALLCCCESCSSTHAEWPGRGRCVCVV